MREAEANERVRNEKLADSLVKTAAEFRQRAADSDDQVEARTYETCAAHVEAQVASWASDAWDPYGPNWEKLCEWLAEVLASIETPQAKKALRSYKKARRLAE